MKRIKIILFSIVFLMIGSIIMSCVGEDDMSDSFGKLTLKLSDAPLDYNQFKEVNITIDKIEIRKKGGSFINLMNKPMKSNLLELVNGVTQTMVEMELPVGDYDLVRLYMSSSEMLMKNGNTYLGDMHYEDSSGSTLMQNGMMMNNDTESIDISFDSFLTIMNGVHEEYLLDIDVNQSFMLEDIEYTNMDAGMMMDISGFSFYPVMRFVQMSTSGTLKGVVQDEHGYLANVTITLMHEGESYTSTHTDENGNYTLIGIPEGIYTIIAEMNGYMMDSTQNDSVMGSFEMMSHSILNMNFYLTLKNK